jgi:hypothetical protein
MVDKTHFRVVALSLLITTFVLQPLLRQLMFERSIEVIKWMRATIPYGWLLEHG